MNGRLHLRRFDPERNIARFYELSVEPTLFGEVVLRREWGRVGYAGREVLTFYATEVAAELAMAKCLKDRLRHGYTLCDNHDLERGDTPDKAR